MTLRGLILVLVLMLIVAGGVLAFPRLEGSPPGLGGPETVALGKAGRDVVIEVNDEGSGLRRLEIQIIPKGQPGAAKSLTSKRYPGTFFSGGTASLEPERIELSLDPRALALPDGEAEIVVRAHDHSWRGGFEGNTSELRIPVTIDTQPPRVAVASRLTYVRRGGAAVAIYSISNDTAVDGVRVGDAFFPGYPLPGRAPADVATTGSWRAAIFAVPVEGEKNPDVDVVAADAAGNETKVGFPARIRERSFPPEEIRLSDSFLEKVPPPLARESGLEGKTPLETFQRVNQELRARNEDRIREIVASSGNQVQWLGVFEQMINTSVTSLFAEQRSYTVANGGGKRRKVSSARHYGFDLASTAHAAVTAANGGRVLYAGPLGIYGNTVVLDHGLGLTTLYGHLSNIAVEEGQRVEKGGELGRSGKTGLAGGDHLHFAVLVGETYVDPLEWWDPKWVAGQVETPLGIAAEAAADSTDASS